VRLLIGSALFVKLSNAAVVVLFARLFGVSGFGQLNFALAFAMIVRAFIDFGTAQYGSRAIATTPQRSMEITHEVVATRFILLLLLTPVYLLFTAIAVRWCAHSMPLLLAYGLTCLPLPFHLIWLLRGVKRIRYAARIRAITQLAYIGVMLLLVFWLHSLIVVPLSLAASLILDIFLIRRKLAQQGIAVSLLPKPPVLPIAVLRASRSYALFPLSSTLFNYADFLLLGLIADHRAIGLYAAASVLMRIFATLRSALTTALTPTLKHLYRRDRECLTPFCFHFEHVLIAVALPLAVGGTLLAPRLTALIWGHTFREGGTAFIFLLWAFACTLLTFFYPILLRISGQTELMGRYLLIAALINIALNIALIPLYSFLGSAIAALASQVVLSLLMRHTGRRLAPFRTLKHYPKPLFASLVMALTLRLFPEWHVVLLVFLGASVYLLVLLLLRGISLADARELMRLLRTTRQG
jgi:O-antigen/teichoic acid export membrane protein